MASNIKDTCNIQNYLENALEQKDVHLILNLLNETSGMTDISDFLKLCEAPLNSTVTANFNIHDIDTETESSDLTEEINFSRLSK